MATENKRFLVHLLLNTLMYIDFLFKWFRIVHITRRAHHDRPTLQFHAIHIQKHLPERGASDMLTAFENNPAVRA